MIEPLDRLYDAWNRRELEHVAEIFHPDAEFRTSGDYPGVAAVYRGHDGVRAFWRDFNEIWEDLRIEPHRYEELGDRALVLWRFSGTGRGGIVVERDGAHLARVEDGLIVDLQAYGSWPRALAAAGLGG
ncbi:MAG TPA: nuclear transport factor 2 family protein [Thermoleophilaceae bacterium]|jgi:ketosteroid isomerase-like protein